MSSLLCRTDAEFVGGPLDGYCQKFALPPDPYVGIVMLSDSALGAALRWLLTQLFRRRRQVPVRMAIYELEENGSHYRYRHVGTQLTASTKLRHVGRIRRSSHLPISADHYEFTVDAGQRV